MCSSVSTASSFMYSDLEIEAPRQVLSALSLHNTMDAASGAVLEKDAVVEELPSFYHVCDMNKEPVAVLPRLARVPSQYQLESLTEVYVFDIPRLSSASAKPMSSEDDLSAETALDFEVPMAQLLPRFLPSEYVAEALSSC